MSIIKNLKYSRTQENLTTQYINMGNFNELPASELKNLLIELARIESLTDKLLRDLQIPKRFDVAAAAKVLSEATISAEVVIRIRCLNQLCVEADSHYGWVLASDYALIGRMFGSNFVHGRHEAEDFMLNVCGKYEKTKAKLKGLNDVYPEGMVDLGKSI